MMVRPFIALFLVATTAYAQVGGAGGSGNPKAPVLQAGSGGAKYECPTIQATAGDLAVAKSGATCTIDLGVNASEFGSCTGDVSSEFCNPAHFPGPIDGGTGTGDTLTLNPTSSASPATNSLGVKFCGTSPDIASNSITCVTFLNSNTTIGTSGILNIARLGPGTSGTITQTQSGSFAGLFPLVVGLGGGFTYQVTDSTILTPWNLGEFDLFSPTLVIKNTTDDNWQGAILYGFKPAFQWSRTGTGNLAATALYAVDPAITAPPAGVTLTDLYVLGGHEPTGTLGGTLTNVRYVYHPALTKGTNRGQDWFTEMTEAGAPPAGDGWWNLVAGAPNRMTFTNESGHKWAIGYTSMVGGAWAAAGAGNALAADNTARWISANDTSTAPVITNDDGIDLAVPGGIKAFAMTCGLSAAPDNGVGTQTRTFTLRDDNADTALGCTISETALSCTDREDASPIALAAGSLISWSSTAAATPLASDVTCTLFYTVDAF